MLRRVKDLTRDSIAIHILTMAAPATISMLAGIAHHLINLYFVTRIGTEVTAGINAAIPATFMVSALTQVLGTGTTVLISHSVGGKDLAATNLLFNQSLVLSAICAAIIVIPLNVLIPAYMRTMSHETQAIEAGIDYIRWASPAHALLFPMIALSATLRGTGVVRPSVLLFAMTVVLNAALAPVFIAGWGTGIAFGAKGAGLATSVAVVIGLAFMWAHFFWSQQSLTLRRSLLTPQLRQWWRILAIGLPAGAEFVLMFLTGAVVYFLIRDVGASAQAGFGIGLRILQTILLPGMSIASAAGPIAGQSFGARNAARVNEVFWTAAALGTGVMLATTALVQLRSTQLVGWFASDADSAETAAIFLQLMSWTFVAQGLVYVCAYMFQSLGNTVPSLISASTRFVIFAASAAWLSQRPGFHMNQLWYLLTVSVAVQAALSLWLLRLEFRRRLPPLRTVNDPLPRSC